MPTIPSYPEWHPGTPALCDDDLRSPIMLVVHYWAVWNYHLDSELDQRLLSLRPQYEGRIVLRSCDTDRPENRRFLSAIASVPTLGSFTHGSCFKVKVGLRSESELRRILDGWLAETAGQ